MKHLPTRTFPSAYNVLEEPWVLVEDFEGNMHRVAIKEALFSDKYRSTSGTSFPESFGTEVLLYSIFQTALLEFFQLEGLDDADQIEVMHSLADPQAGEELFDAFVVSYKENFYLFPDDPDTPGFFQVPRSSKLLEKACYTGTRLRLNSLGDTRFDGKTPTSDKLLTEPFDDGNSPLDLETLPGSLVYTLLFTSPHSFGQNGLGLGPSFESATWVGTTPWETLAHRLMSLTEVEKYYGPIREGYTMPWTETYEDLPQDSKGSPLSYRSYDKPDFRDCLWVPTLPVAFRDPDYLLSPKSFFISKEGSWRCASTESDPRIHPFHTITKSEESSEIITKRRKFTGSARLTFKDVQASAYPLVSAGIGTQPSYCLRSRRSTLSLPRIRVQRTLFKEAWKIPFYGVDQQEESISDLTSQQVTRLRARVSSLDSYITCGFKTLEASTRIKVNGNWLNFLRPVDLTTEKLWELEEVLSYLRTLSDVQLDDAQETVSFGQVLDAINTQIERTIRKCYNWPQPGLKGSNPMVFKVTVNGEVKYLPELYLKAVLALKTQKSKAI